METLAENAYYTYYIYYSNYVHYTNSIDYTYYHRFVKILDLQTTCGRTRGRSDDNLGDQFRPAMRARWLSYIRCVYRGEDGAADVGLVVGEGALVVNDRVYAAAGCCKHCSSVTDDAIGL